jgi:hypothetical protein
MMLNFKNLKLKNYFFELIELILGSAIFLCISMVLNLLITGFSLYNLPTSRQYDLFISQFPITPVVDSARIDLTILNCLIVFLVLDILMVLLLKKSIVDSIIGMQYEVQNSTSFFVCKLLLSTCFKSTLVFLWIMSFKIDMFFFSQFLDFYLGYLLLSVVTRVFSHGEYSLLYKIIGLKNR